MATVHKHNQLVKVCLNGNKHLNHVLNSDEINKMTMIENRYPLSKLPVCGNCERLGMWSKGMVGICRHCGTITKKPVTYATYLCSGFDVDMTGETAKQVLKHRDAILGGITC